MGTPVDVLRILEQYHVTVDLGVNRGWANVPCPYCTDGGNHGGFNIAGGYFHCWKCGGKPLAGVLTRILNIPYSEVQTLIEANMGRVNILAVLNKRQAQAVTLTLPGKPLNPMERRYLKGRGFNPDQIVETWKITGGGISGPWKHRIIIPIFQDGKLVTYTGRDITGDSKVRYKNLDIEASVIEPKNTIYGLDLCKSNRGLVLEGPTDVWRLGPGFMATLGTSVTPAQIQLLARRFKHVSIMFDPEAEAQAKARKLAAQLAALGTAVEIIDLELDHDPGDCTPEEVKYIRKEMGV